MSHEELASSPETIFNSFYDSLKLVREVEKLYTGKALGINPKEFSNVRQTASLQELSGIIGNLRKLHFGEPSAKYDQIIDQAISLRTESDPAKYFALNIPGFSDLAKSLVRNGMTHMFIQRRVDTSRVELHHSNGKGNGHARNGAATSDLIVFNHLVRQLVDSSEGRAMQLDREKTRKIVRAILFDDTENADGIEEGTALEIAARRGLFKALGLSAVKEGSVSQDKVGGDFILHPEGLHEVFLDVKKTPTDKIRRAARLTDEQVREPGLYWENPGKAVLWLGSGHSVGNNYSVPNEFTDKIAELARQAASVA